MFLENGTLVPRISDFGYASVSDPSVEECITLPLSKPWTAPEHNFEPFKFEDARKMDVYSLGRLFLWFLQCSGEKTPVSPKEHITVPQEGDDVESWSRVLEDMSTDNSLESLMSKLSLGLPDSETQVAYGLGDHIAKMVSHADTRPTTLDSLVVLLFAEKYVGIGARLLYPKMFSDLPQRTPGFRK